jgi:hypothetical protein
MYAGVEASDRVDSMSEPRGYVYRLSGLDSTGLRALIGRYVQSGTVFGGHISKLWPVGTFGTAGELDDVVFQEWDFGHAFSPAVEVRWRRVVASGSGIADTFDTLLLTEAVTDELAGTDRIGGDWELRSSGDENGVRMHGAANKTLDYVQYIASNRAVQFTRYTAMREELIDELP